MIDSENALGYTLWQAGRSGQAARSKDRGRFSVSAHAEQRKLEYMKNQSPEDRDADARLLKSARANLESLRVALEATVARLQVDEDMVSKDVNSPLTDFRRSLQAVIGIEADLAKRSYEQRSGGEGACPLDLAAARREVTERLIALSQARGS